MDLAKLKKQVEGGEVRTTEDFKRRLLLMFTNAVMYNSTGHDVNIYAKEMANDTLSILNVGIFLLLAGLWTIWMNRL